MLDGLDMHRFSLSQKVEEEKELGVLNSPMKPSLDKIPTNLFSYFRTINQEPKIIWSPDEYPVELLQTR